MGRSTAMDAVNIVSLVQLVRMISLNTFGPIFPLPCDNFPPWISRFLSCSKAHCPNGLPRFPLLSIPQCRVTAVHKRSESPQLNNNGNIITVRSAILFEIECAITKFLFFFASALRRKLAGATVCRLSIKRPAVPITLCAAVEDHQRRVLQEGAL